MAAAAQGLVDELQRSLDNLMRAMAGDAGRPAAAEGLTMLAGEIILEHADVTAAAKSRNLLLRRHTQETLRRAHGRGRIRGITTVAAITGNAVCSVDTAPPKRHRSAVCFRQGGVARETNDLDRSLCLRQDRRPPDSQRQSQRGEESSAVINIHGHRSYSHE